MTNQPSALSDEQLTIGGERLPRGSTSTVTIPAVELADGTWINFRVLVLRGSRPGPVFYLGAAVHGDEINGVHIIQRFLRELHPDQLRGTIVAVPVQNPLGFQVQHRFPLGQLIKSPLDQSPADLWIAFPGNPEGNTTEMMAHVLHREVLAQADYVIDIHTPTTGGRYLPFAFLPPANLGAVTERAEELARAFSPRIILKTTRGIYVQDGTPHVEAAKRGVVGFGVELGEGGRVEQELVAAGVEGLFNVLKQAGLLEGPPKPVPSPVVLQTMVPVRAHRGGLLQASVTLGDRVEEGQVIATITNPLGAVSEEIRAPCSGLLVRATTFPTVMTGERVAQIGVEL